MKGTRWVAAGMAAFVVVFILDFVIHGVLLAPWYEQTAAVWRPKAEANQLMPLMAVSQLVFGLVLAWFYTKGYEPKKKGLEQGLRFGFYVGLTLAAFSGLIWYVVLPVPLALPLAWLGAALVKSVCAGAAIGAVYRRA